MQKRIEEIYAQLNTVGCLGKDSSAGYLRPGYSNLESDAINIIKNEAEKIGLTCQQDAIGNFYAEISGPSGKYIEFGSHMDTVPYGGNYDGVVGIISGLLAIETIVKNKKNFQHGLRLRVWRAEESTTFGLGYVGSSAAFGKLASRYLDAPAGSKTLRQSILELGLKVENIEKGIPTISQSQIDQVLAHLEVHIEQGNVLEVEGIDIGIVTAIRAPTRFKTTIQGSADHSGATPMGVKFRRDANLALAYMLVRMDQAQIDAGKEGADLVQTIGIINSQKSFNAADSRVYQNAQTKVSNFAYFVTDIRSTDDNFRKNYVNKIKEIIKQTAQEFNVDFTISDESNGQAVSLASSPIPEVVKKSCDTLKLKSKFMTSGAGHDVQIVSQQKQSEGKSIPCSLIFIPCLKGKSHCAEEYATTKDIANGIEVLVESCLKL